MDNFVYNSILSVFRRFFVWKTFFGCHVYIILSTAIVDNCVDKSVVFLAFTYSLFCGIIMHNTYFISRKINFTKAKTHSTFFIQLVHQIIDLSNYCNVFYNKFIAASFALSLTSIYIEVVLIEVCPINFCITSIPTPFSDSMVPNVCLAV